jgi:hypothetical protein
MAASPEPIPSSIVASVTNMAMAGVSTPDAIQAVQDLSTQATMPVAGTAPNVSNAVNTASVGIVSTMPSPMQTITALKALGDAAMSPTPVAQSTVLPVSNIVMTGVSTTSAMTSVQNLTRQAMTSAPGDPVKITADVNNIMSNINNASTAPSVSTPMTPITPMTSEPIIQAQQSIQSLAQGASSSAPLPNDLVNPVANIALSAMSSQKGIEAVKALAGQSLTAAAGDPTKIDHAVQTAMADMSNSSMTMPANTSVSSTPAPVNGSSAKQIEPVNGCYPIRTNDMSKIMPMKDGESTFEDYQAFKSTLSSS